MTSRLLRSTKMRWVLTLLLVLTLSVSMVAQVLAVGPVGTASGFEDDDGNLAPENPINFDWNSFAPVTWTGTAPNQTADKTVSGWRFTGLSDAQATTSDTGFAGGTKQDNNCADVISAKAPNKDDLKRIYLSHKTVGGDIFLNLAWVRITQNTTSPSAHIGFEFNQGETSCGEPGGLVHRTAGDVLIVYDFEGGATDTPVITLRRWVTSGACEVSSNSAPCWGPATNLTALGFAEAKVNTTTTVSDSVASPGETLGLNEFGEAGINLTDAGVFDANVCTSFGKAYGVSRSSGNSGTAQMKDIVGPGSIRIANCGSLIIAKVTDPSPDPTDTSFSFTLDGSGSNSATTLPKSFSLKNGESNTSLVKAATDFSVVETVPANWDLTAATCDNSSGTLSGNTLSGITVAADEEVTCTFYNDLQQGALKILKQSTKTGNPLVSNAGAVFSYSGPSGNGSVTDDGTGDESSTVGEICVSGLLPGSYTVNETGAPAGYGDAGESDVAFTVVNGTDCGSNEPSNAVSAVFKNPPLSDIQVNFRDGGSGETSATISCDNVTGTSDLTAATGWDTTETVTDIEAPTTVICTIVIDP